MEHVNAKSGHLMRAIKKKVHKIPSYKDKRKIIKGEFLWEFFSVKYLTASETPSPTADLGWGLSPTIHVTGLNSFINLFLF